MWLFVSKQCGNNFFHSWSCRFHCYAGTLDAILKMIRYDGFSGFYKGMSTKIVQSVLAAAILFMVKEELVKGSKWLLTAGGAVVAKPKTRWHELNSKWLAFIFIIHNQASWIKEYTIWWTHRMWFEVERWDVLLVSTCSINRNQSVY